MPYAAALSAAATNANPPPAANGASDREGANPARGRTTTVAGSSGDGGGGGRWGNRPRKPLRDRSPTEELLTRVRGGRAGVSPPRYGPSELQRRFMRCNAGRV